MGKFLVRLWLKNLRRYEFKEVDTLIHAQEMALKKRRLGHSVKILKK